jgi:hypothetical protein
MQIIIMEPLQPCYKELEPFILHGTEVPKKDLLLTIANRVSYYAFTMLKLLQFHSIGKNEQGELFIR